MAGLYDPPPYPRKRRPVREKILANDSEVSVDEPRERELDDLVCNGLPGGIRVRLLPCEAGFQQVHVGVRRARHPERQPGLEPGALALQQLPDERSKAQRFLPVACWRFNDTMAFREPEQRERLVIQQGALIDGRAAGLDQRAEEAIIPTIAGQQVIETVAHELR